MLRVAVLASGRGSNFAAILKAIDDGSLTNVEVALAISNKSQAGALEIARSRNIPAIHLSVKQCDDEDKFGRAFLSHLDHYKVNFIMLAGYLKKISPVIVRKFRHRILNIHPALLPSFGGAGLYGHFVHEAVLEYGCKVSGVTVHLIDEEYDTGPIVLQRCVPVHENDTPDSLAERILQQEHKVYAEAIQHFADERVKVEGRRVVIAPKR